MPKIITVDGIIAAGKSTLSTILKREFNKKGLSVQVVDEPVNKWVSTGVLNAFYEDQDGWAFTFLVSAVNDMITVCNDALQTPADVYILDRTPFSVLFFVELLQKRQVLDPLEVDLFTEIYVRLIKDLYPVFNSPDVSIYLRPPVHECMKRLQQRNRDAENNHISEEYQRELQEIHDKKLLQQKGLVLVDTGLNFITSESVAREIFLQVLSKMGL